MKEKIAAFLAVLASVWIVGVWILVLVGFIGIWWNAGFSAAASTFAPWNLWNLLAVLLSLSPGLLFLWIAYKLDPTRFDSG